MATSFRTQRGNRPAFSSPSRLRPQMRMGELLEHWRAARSPAPKTYHGARRSVERLTCLVGDIGIGDLTHVHLFDFRDAIACMPRCQTVLERQKAFDILVRRFMLGNDPRPRVAPTTVSKSLHAIQSLIGFAYGERWVRDDDAHNIPVSGHNPFQRRPFTLGEVSRLFAMPLFVKPWHGQERPHHVSNETVRWLMLLALMTGARLEELGQLHVADIDRQDGVTFLSISETVYGGKAAKSIKSPTSRRRVPIHHRLVDVGFLRFVDRRCAEGEMRLFPDLERDAFDRYTPRASRRCNMVIDQVCKDPELVFHSFRHLFKDLCRSAGVLESVNDQLTGHLPVTVGARYGRGVDLRTLADAVGSLNFEMVDWEPILRAV